MLFVPSKGAGDARPAYEGAGYAIAKGTMTIESRLCEDSAVGADRVHQGAERTSRWRTQNHIQEPCESPGVCVCHDWEYLGKARFSPSLFAREALVQERKHFGDIELNIFQIQVFQVVFLHLK